MKNGLKALNDYRRTMKQTRHPNPAYVDPEALIRRLSERMNRTASMWPTWDRTRSGPVLTMSCREGRFLTSGGMGTMGYSIPAAMGAKLGDMSKQVIAVCGDGSFQMSMMELATIQQYHIPVKIVVFRNNYLGMVREYPALLL